VYFLLSIGYEFFIVGFVDGCWVRFGDDDCEFCFGGVDGVG